MFRNPALALALMTSASLAACSQSDDGQDTGAATQEDQMATDQATADQDMESQMAAMTGPFAESERKMHQEMKSAVGVDVADTWTRKMIAHHQGAIDMARAFLAQDGGSAGAREMAQQTIDKQSKDIQDLESLLKDGQPQQSSAQPYAAAERSMMQAMMAAKRGDLTETFLRKMLEHHKGGVALSEVLLDAGGDEQITAKARMTREDQGKEAEMVEGMLSA